VDALPAHARLSTVLTGNELGQLGALEQVPDETRVNEYKLTELSELFIAHQDEPQHLKELLHRRAKDMLREGRVEEAWLTLLTFNDR
jgi:hypothetical protein